MVRYTAVSDERIGYNVHILIKSQKPIIWVLVINPPSFVLLI